MIKVNIQLFFDEVISLHLALPAGPWQLCSSEILSRINAHFRLAQVYRVERWKFGKRPGGPRSAFKEVLHVWHRGLHGDSLRWLAYLTN
jgi:hypothetical protein